MQYKKEYPYFYTSIMLLVTATLMMLKLFNVVKWNWWIVFIPMITYFLLLLIAVIYFFYKQNKLK